MAEPEVLVPIRCPICLQESLAGFRFSVLEDALATGEIRLYANCHVTSWQGSAQELAAMREYLDTVWGTSLQKSCPEFFELDRFLDGDSLSFIYNGVLTAEEMNKVPELAPNGLTPEYDEYQELVTSIHSLASDFSVTDAEIRGRLRSLVAASKLVPNRSPVASPANYVSQPWLIRTSSRSEGYNVQSMSQVSEIPISRIQGYVIRSEHRERMKKHHAQVKDFTTH